MIGEEKKPRPLKVCFVVPYAYSLFNTETKFPFGGSEVRSWIFGIGLAKEPGLEISFAVFNHLQAPVEQYGDIAVWRDEIISASQSFVRPAQWWRAHQISRRLLNFLNRRLWKTAVQIPPGQRITHREFRTYRKIDADVYCVFGVHSLAAKVAAFCKMYSKKFVLFAASDEDFSDLYYRDSTEVNSYGNVGFLASYAIENADTIICQTEQQGRLCLDKFGRQPFVVRNPIQKFDDKPDFDFSARGNYALWVGKSDRTKQPDKMLELAARCPDIPFIMVMSRTVYSLHDRILKMQLPNTEIIDYLPYEKMENLFKNAKAFVSTSKFEGFPNTFLDAGKHGVPIASLIVNPDSFIDAHQCGIAAEGNVEKLEEGLRRLFTSPEHWQTCAKNVVEYVRSVHNVDDNIAAVHEILLSDAKSARLPIINL